MAIEARASSVYLRLGRTQTHVQREHRPQLPSSERSLCGHSSCCDLRNMGRVLFCNALRRANVWSVPRIIRNHNYNHKGGNMFTPKRYINNMRRNTDIECTKPLCVYSLSSILRHAPCQSADCLFLRPKHMPSLVICRPLSL